MAKDFLLHICCAPCGGGCVERLKNEADISPVLYYSNSNLCDEKEFERRLSSVRLLAEEYGLALEIDPYDHASWLQAVAGFEDEPERGARCARCFAYNLERSRQKAQQMDADFATTLTVSPLKSGKTIFGIGEKMPGFQPWDFKKKNGYKLSCEIAAKLGFYRQNFCGCEFSKRDNPACQKKEDAK